MEKYLRKTSSQSQDTHKGNAEDNSNEGSGSGVKIPAILGGKYFEIISHEHNDNNDKVKAACLMCKSNGKDTVISGSFKATTNFKLHMKV